MASLQVDAELYLFAKTEVTEPTGDIHSSAESNVLMPCVGSNLPLESKLFENGNRSTSVVARIGAVMSFESGHIF